MNEIERLKRELAECRFDYRVLDDAVDALVEERAKLREKLASCEACQQEARKLIRKEETNARDGGLMDRMLSRLDSVLRSADHEALDAALEQRIVEVLDAIEARIDNRVRNLEVADLYGWGEDTGEACQNLLDAHRAALEQAKREERERCERLERELAECREELAGALMEAADCAEELAAAEAREREAVRILGDIPQIIHVRNAERGWAPGCSPTIGAVSDAIDGVREKLHSDDHAALDAALEQAENRIKRTAKGCLGKYQDFEADYRENIANALEQARMEAVEWCCAVICSRCAEGVPAFWKGGLGWWHGPDEDKRVTNCYASEIREAEARRGWRSHEETDSQDEAPPIQG